uniref:Uncharacterized protein n=1 Tax=Arthrobacter sp. J3.40 TaxID=347209 RepID=I3W112_9MICC|nr:hypothetical protein [Arthrobacter sp. J3.40]
MLWAGISAQETPCPWLRARVYLPKVRSVGGAAAPETHLNHFTEQEAGAKDPCGYPKDGIV